ncbi:uncharacterized protein LOC116179154 [Photinus pyralis]|uniref:uncharacterized protein LOC116179154 n=1 Tax=Photinus pyralis TaxID=7054 RepID=UPI0012677391|nr:uncharacterized protein LOC116179154 [Photinus pyralis]
MKLYVIVLLFAACISADDDGEENFYDRLQDLVKSKCAANAGEEEAEKAIDALDTFQRQWQVAPPTENLYGVAFYNYCVTNAKNFTTYLLTAVDAIMPCLSSEEEYLKPFIITTYGDYNQHLCKFMELLTVSESKKRYKNKCDEIMSDNPELDPLRECYKESTVFGENATATTISKQKLCEDLQDIRCCYDKIFKENCPEIPEYTDLKQVLLAQGLAQCADELASSEEESSERNSE